MRIEAINIEGFGKIRGIVIDRIGTSVTCVYGLNEAGKTTLQNCITALLYGMKIPRRRGRYYEMEHDLFDPWERAPYSAAMVYRLDSGERFEVRRTFRRDEERVTIWDANGRDVTAEFPLDATRERTFAESHLGLTKNQFIDLCMFRQARIDEMRQGEALARKLESLVDTTTEDATARDAIAKIDDAIDGIGTPQAYTKPLGRCVARINQLGGELARVQAKRREVFQAAEKRKALTAELGALRQWEQTLRRRLKEMGLREAQEVVSAVEALDLDIASLRKDQAALAAYKDFPSNREQSLLVSEARREDLEKRAEEIAKELETVEATIARQQEILGRQPDLDTATEQDVQRARENFAVLENKHGVLRTEEAKREEVLAEREVISRELKEIGPAREILDREDWRDHLDACEPDVHEEEAINLHRTALLQQGEKIESLKHKRALVAMLNWLLLGCSALMLALVTANLSKGTPILLGATLAGFALTFFGKRALERIVQEREHLLKEKLAGLETREVAAQRRRRDWEEMLRRAGASSAGELRELGHKLWELRRREKDQQAKLELLNQGIEALTEETRELEERILPLVKLAGIETSRATAREMESFLSLWSEREEVRRQLNLALQEKAERQKGEKRLRDDLEATGAEILSILGKAGVKSVSEFRQACRMHERHRLLSADLETLLNRRTALLRNRDLEEWRHTAHSLADEVDAPAASDPTPSALTSPEPEDADTLAYELKALETEIRRQELEISRLQGVEESEMAGERDVAEIEEELEGCKQQQAALLRRRSGLTRARDLLAEISRSYHGMVAPRLNEVCGESVHRITGKYNELRVEPMESDAQRFSINVRIPETGEFQPVDVLSRGTIDQCYFVLKLSILSLLTHGKERPPLLLDDTFANHDRKRRGEAVKFLSDLASEWQVIYFTCHQQHAEEIRGLLADSSKRTAGEFTIITSSA